MNLCVLSLLFAVSVVADARYNHHRKREVIPNICDYNNNINTVKCFCTYDMSVAATVATADCSLTPASISNNLAWSSISTLKNVTRLTLSNAGALPLTHIPTYALKNLNELTRFHSKNNQIERIHAYAFANLSKIKDINLSNNQIEKLEPYAFSHHRDLLSISLDRNKILEINRDVFYNLYLLEKLFLTDNKITTIHDKAFVHLVHLEELEINRNKLFSLNSETFSGLISLQRLDLSNNELEVIGDNTFSPLINLVYLNLDSNKIQMLDEKAFYGLSKLSHLSLARNKLERIDNAKTFEGLYMLISLNLNENQLTELKTEVLAPILSHFYAETSNLNVGENNFPCDCRLEWSSDLVSKTQNLILKTALENLKCNPDSKLMEQWNKTLEREKSEPPAFEDNNPSAQPADYEYYDDTQLGGKLFYIDVRPLLNCNHLSPNELAIPQQTKDNIPKAIETSTLLIPKEIETSPFAVPTTPTTKSNAELVTPELINHGTLDLGAVENRLAGNEGNKFNGVKMSSNVHNEINEGTKPISYTTTVLSTVSAKPDDSHVDHNGMASDEARTENRKIHRSIQEELKQTPQGNGAYKKYISAYNMLTLILLCILLVH